MGAKAIVGPERIGLVGCVSQKRDAPVAARDLYVSTLFVGRRASVEKTCARWFILSAKHGLISPDDVVAPYDQRLGSRSAPQRREWSARVLASLQDALGALSDIVFEIHAGAEYRDFGLTSGLQSCGAEVVVPTLGLGIGKQLAFYKRLRKAQT